ncbi:MAG: hypothetical protein ACLFUC_09040 [Bacteroidales bacterium]
MKFFNILVQVSPTCSLTKSRKGCLIESQCHKKITIIHCTCRFSFYRGYIFGDFNPSAKLPVTMPLDEDQLPERTSIITMIMAVVTGGFTGMIYNPNFLLALV